MIGEEGGVGGGEVLEDIFLDTPIEGAPLTAGNSSFINDVIKDVQNDPDLGYLVLSLLIAFSWSIYIILFNARVQGTILTTILRRFVKSGDLTIDMSHCDHRVWVELNGPELHIYNRSNLYARLEKTFGLESQLLGTIGKIGKGDKDKDKDGDGDVDVEETAGQQVRDMSFWQDWRDLIPVIKVDLNMGENVDLSLFLPPTNTSSNIITALSRNARLIEKEDRPKHSFSSEKWRKFCKLSSGWVDCWHVPELQLSISYTYHPVPPVGPSPQANVSTPEKEELLLSPIRAPHRKKSPMEIIKILHVLTSHIVQ
ncbi:hypothetical protein Pmani_005990 [Petrolisthes manimaculis]|uniref:Uncharacterized protein n=1 Tax=Petrolisthes manimaculis TaxID=1843537 RepID=A0AAE1QBT1_9EUCA|nr:hypothetical protein Pmani_005990 [Petrolisthes manimaculis]